MKKLLAICSIFFTVCASFTACGDNDKGHDVDNEHGIMDNIPKTEEKYESNYESREERVTTATGRGNSVKDHADDIIDGVEDAGEDIINGAGDAAEDVIDGLDGSREHDAKDTTTTKNKR